MDLREALNILADVVPPEDGLPERTRRSAHRHRIVTASVGVLTIVAIVAGGWMGVRAFRPPVKVIPPVEDRSTTELAKLEWFGDTGPLVQTRDSVWVAMSPKIYRLDGEGTKVAEWRFGNDPLSPNPPPYANIVGVAAPSDDLVYVAYTRINLPDGRDPCGSRPFVSGSAQGCGRVALIRNGKAEDRAVVAEPVIGIVAGDGYAWVSGVSELYRVTSGDDVLYPSVKLPRGLRAVRLMRNASHLWLLAEGPESSNVLLKLDARTGKETARAEIPGSAIAVDDAAVWGAGLEREGARTVSTVFRVDAETLQISGRTQVVTTFLAGSEQGFTPLSPLLSASGDVWAGSTDGVVYRIDGPSSSRSPGRVLGSIRTLSYPAAMMRRGNTLWTAHIDGRILRTGLEPPVDTIARPEDAPDYAEPSPGPGTPRPAGFDRVELLGDDRTIVVRYLGGACERLDHVAITYEETRVLVRVMIVDDTIPSGSACPSIGIQRQTATQLREPLGNRTIING